MKTILPLLFCSAALVLHAAPKPLVASAPDGRLAHDADEHGNRVPDFSTCGYAAQARPIPSAPVRIVVEVESGGSTAAFIDSLPAAV